MSWTHHIDEDERRNLERKAIDDLARLVRIGFLAGLWGAGNKARESQGLHPIRRPMNLHKSPLEQRLDNWIEDVVRDLYQRAQTPGVSQLAWLERQFGDLKENAKKLFASH